MANTLPSSADQSWAERIVGETATPTPLVVPPYRMVTFGDSRAVSVFTNTSILPSGSSTGVSILRTGGWIAALLGDTEIVGNFGVSGDTLISSSTTTGWNGTARVNSKTVANCLRLRPDIVWIQYGINDIVGGATSANLIAAFKSFVSELIAGGTRVLLESINLFDPTASAASIPPSSAAAALQVINEVTAAMQTWCAGFPGMVAFVDTNPLIKLSTTSYANPAYMTSDTLGVHLNKIGSQIVGTALAKAARTLLPNRSAAVYANGPTENPNLIDWNSPTMFTTVEAGSMTVSTPTWNLDTSTGNPWSGLPYAEVTATCTAIASGTSRVRIEVHATDIAGATPKWPIVAGDVLQASAYLVVDDGAGGVPPVQSVFLRQRLYSDSKFADFGQLGSTSDLTTIYNVFQGRAFTTTITTSLASASISSPAVGAGLPLQTYLEIPRIGATARIRIYAPMLRVVSLGQPVSVTAGASPYTYYNGPSPFVTSDYVNQGYFGRDLQVAVAPGSGGTISQIAIARGPTVSGSFLNPVNTNLTSGVFTLKPGDGLTVTWATTAPTLAVMQVS